MPLGFAGAALIAFSISTANANTPPTVDAGKDTTTRLGRTFSMFGTAVDDGQPNPELTILWKQIKGPVDGDSIFYPDVPGTTMEFYKLGEYWYELSANDGVIVKRDTTIITVLDSIPFKVLTPVAGQKVALGSTCMIGWQIDPVGTIVSIRLSADEGMTWEPIEAGQVSTNPYSWKVPDTLAPGKTYTIMVREYDRPAVRTYSETFEIYDPANAILHRGQRVTATSPVEPAATYTVQGRTISAGMEKTAKLSPIVDYRADKPVLKTTHR